MRNRITRSDEFRTARLLLISVLSAAAVMAQVPPPGPGGGPGGGGPNFNGRPGANGGGPPAGGNTPYTLKGVLVVIKKTSTKDESYPSDNKDTAAVWAKGNAAVLALDTPKISSTGDSTSTDNSSFYGLNAALLATKGAKVTVTGGTIDTTGSGANGAFATGTGSSISLSATAITTAGEGAHGVMATQAGSIKLDHVDITTKGTRAAAVATDRGGGTVAVTGGTFTTNGTTSPGIYSTGSITVTDATINATAAEAAVVEGSNSITLTNTALTGSTDRGVMIYQSFSGDARNGKGLFRMIGGSLTANTGPIFYVTNTTAAIAISKVKVTGTDSVLIDASAGQWGQAGSNGGHATVLADAETLKGNVTADTSSSISLSLTNKSTLTGTVTQATLSLDATSKWEVTNDSTLAGFTDAEPIQGRNISNITGNGHTVTYDNTAAANKWLNGRAYQLVQGGLLKPSQPTNNPNNNNLGRNNGEGGVGGFGGNRGGGRR